jgi:hypothetical protein
MTTDENDLLRFMSDALIEVRSPTGWQPSHQDAAAFILGLERTLVDQDRLVTLLQAYEPLNPIPRPNRMVLTEDELEGIAKHGIRSLYQASVPRFLQTCSDPLQLALLHESIHDELTDYWWSIIKRESTLQNESIWDEQRREQAELVPLDRSPGSHRVIQHALPESNVDDTHAAAANLTDLVFETAVSIASSGEATLTVDWIDPIPEHESILRITVYDVQRRQLGHGEGHATETLIIPLTYETGTAAELFVDGEYIVAPDSIVRFIHRLDHKPQAGGQRDGP